MITLGVDSSTAFLTVCLSNKKKILAHYQSGARLRHSALLAPMIKRALKKARRRIDEVELFSVGIGPGSFTGLRVGVTAVRALAIALHKPIVGVPTMDAIAHNGLKYLKREKSVDDFPEICPLLDAKKRQVYACIYRHRGDTIERESQYLLEPIEELVKRLRGPVLFLGDGVDLYKQSLVNKRGFTARFAAANTWLPKASVISRMASQSYEKGKTDNPYDLTPLYLYARDCNVTKK